MRRSPTCPTFLISDSCRQSPKVAGKEGLNGKLTFLLLAFRLYQPAVLAAKEEAEGKTMISSLLSSFSRLSVRSTTLPFNYSSSASSPLINRLGHVRNAAQLAPRRTKYRKAHKGRVPIPSGGSLKGTTLTMGEYGIRVLTGVRLSAKQLQSAQTALKRKLRAVKGSQVFMRVFPDIPVCVKGNETRMGKGKGSFEFWACR